MAGFSLGLRLAGLDVTTIGYVEIEPYCQEIIKARIRDGCLDWAPIIKDIRTADFRPMAGLVDVVTGGVPCQPDSYSGRRRGADDERDLWPQTIRVIGEVGPRYCIFESVPGFTKRYFHTVRPKLRSMGYETAEELVTAAECGAYHRRERLWIFAYANEVGRGERARPTKQESQYQEVEGVQQPIQNGSVRLVARPWELSEWPLESRIRRVDDGPPTRVAQLRALGNGIVPQCIAEFLRRVQ